MATEKELIKKKLALYDNADADLITEVGKTEQAVLKKVLGLLNKVKTVDGRLVNDDTSLQLVNQIYKETLKIISQSTYKDKVNGYLRNFDEITNLNKELIEKANAIKLSKVNVNTYQKNAIDDLTAQLTTPASIDANLARPIKQVIFQSIVTGSTLEEAKSVISNFIAGDEQRYGHMRRWTAQIARDSLTQYDGLVNDVIRQEYGLDAYRYVGSIIKDSRPQCVRWVGLDVIPVEDLQKEINWAKRNGKGFNDDCTPETFARYRGGYNCRHMAIPVRLSNVKTEEE